MLNRANIEEVEKILGSISRQNAHILFLQHFSDFSEFFINTISKGYKLEETFGSRAQQNLLPPLSFTLINSVIFDINNSNAQYHDALKKFQFPFNELINHQILKFEFPAVYNNKNTLETISKNTKIPKETSRKFVNELMNIDLIQKDKTAGLIFNFDIPFNTNLFKKYNLNAMKQLSKNWSFLIDSLISQGILNNKHKISNINFSQLDDDSYIKNLMLLHWYYLIALTYIQNTNLNYNETCIVSSALFFYKDKKIFDTKNIDFYEAGILRPVNMSSIAESTAIPFATVRRSVQKLVNKKYLIKKNNNIFVSDLILDYKKHNLQGKWSLPMLHDILVIASEMHSPPDY